MSVQHNIGKSRLVDGSRVTGAALLKMYLKAVRHYQHRDRKFTLRQNGTLLEPQQRAHSQSLLRGSSINTARIEIPHPVRTRHMYPDIHLQTTAAIHIFRTDTPGRFSSARHRE